MRLILRRLIKWTMAPTPAERAAERALFAAMRARSVAARRVLSEDPQAPPQWEYERMLDRLEASRPAAVPAADACAPDTRLPPASDAASPPLHPPNGRTQ